MSYPDNIKEKTINFPICPEIEVSPQDNISDYMNQMKPDNYTRRIIPDCTDKKKYRYYRFFKFYWKQGMIVEKVHEIISFEQSIWAEKYRSFSTLRRNEATRDFEKDYDKTMHYNIYGKTEENLRKRFKTKFNEKILMKKVFRK